ncbi:hypothetical protein [Halobacillus sp. KGW1]|uniref:hypothetical protein n=1 Tax=Halobacillus sp. KGW1 TaxID=1793726 RepID=UPI000780600C|nr:hypothetical protein [Halobacillus sp. KGW1]
MRVDLNDKTETHEIPLEHKKLEAGIFGKLFGTGNNAASNIAGLIVLGLLAIILWLIGFKTTEESEPILKTLTPILTLTLGYLFGKHTQ